MDTMRTIIGTIAVMMALHPATGFTWDLEEVAEEVCGVVEGVSCSFDDHEGTYKFGPYDPVAGGMGKVRSQAAYCLIRDGDGARADATIGQDWYQFGASSRFHLTHAGQGSNGVYGASGQRLLDLVVFGHTLEGAELQNLATVFPRENERGVRYRCAKKMKLGKASVCTKLVPYVRTGYYMTVDTHSYDWALDIDQILSEYFSVSYPGLEIQLGQHVPFLYGGSTELAGADLNLTDGVIPTIAGGMNAWAWGVLPVEASDTDLATSAFSVQFPAFTLGVASVNLGLAVDLQGHYSLRESGDPENPGAYTATPNDPDAAQVADEGNSINSPEGGVTSTHLRASAGIDFTATVCIDFGWFGTRCGDFEIFKDELLSDTDLVNMVGYEPDGDPLFLQWSGETTVVGTQAAQQGINACFSAPTIDQPAEEPASPQEMKAFTDAIQDTFVAQYTICQKNAPPPPTVAMEEPSFRLCNTLGEVLEPRDGLYQATDQ